MSQRYYAAALAGARPSASAISADRVQGGCLSAPAECVGVARHAQEGQAVAPHDDLVAVLQGLPVDAGAVDEHAVEAAVVEQAHTVGMAHDQRVAAGYGGVVEAHVRHQAAPDAGPLACQRDHSLLAVL